MQKHILPITALAIVIFSHILSLISSPESGSCITFTMVAMSVFPTVRGRSSNSVKDNRMIRIMLCSKKRFCDLSERKDCTVLWVRSCKCSSVRNPCSRVNGSNWLSFGGEKKNRSDKSDGQVFPYVYLKEK